MPSCKKNIRNTLGYVILALNTVAANHLAPTSEVPLGEKFTMTVVKSVTGVKVTERLLQQMPFSHRRKTSQQNLLKRNYLESV